MNFTTDEEWTTKEKYILACCVARSGDQNWGSVSRTIKLILESTGDAAPRPAEFFSQKNCALKYNELLNCASVSKRKSRGGTEAVNIETPGEQVLRKLTFERNEELDKTIKAERERFRKLKCDIEMLKSGKLDDQLPRIWESIQNGQGGPLESLISEPSQDSLSGYPLSDSHGISPATVKAMNHALASTSTSVTASSTSLTPVSRPQRAPKETARFKDYIEQRQKQQAKYHHQTSFDGTQEAPGQAPSNAAAPMPESPEDVLNKGLLTTASQPVVGPSPVQVQKLNAEPRQGRLELANAVTAQPRGEAVPKTEPARPLPSPLLRKQADGKSSLALSDLLSAPTTELKAAANKISETLKEPIKDIHPVTKESYQAYRKALSAEPDCPATATAPVLSKLLESGAHAAVPAAEALLESPRKQSPEKIVPTVPPKVSPSRKEGVSLKAMLRLQKPELPPVATQCATKEVELDASSATKPNESESLLLKLTEEELATKTAPLTIDVQDVKDTTEMDSSYDEPTPKKPMLDKMESSQESSEQEDLGAADSVAAEPKEKRRGKGLRTPRGGQRKKSLPGVLKLDLSVKGDEDAVSMDSQDSERGEDTESEIASVVDTKELTDVDDVLPEDDKERLLKKCKAPLTPMLSSPASPCLSTGSNYDPEMAQQQRAWRKSIMLVWKAAASHKYANVFGHPVTDEEAPGYSSIIFRPMDLSLIKKNIETGVIHSTAEFRRDIMLMFQNALMYNRVEHDVYRMAEEMRDDVMEQIESFINAQLMVQTNSVADVKGLRTKSEGAAHSGHTRQSSKPGSAFISL